MADFRYAGYLVAGLSQWECVHAIPICFADAEFGKSFWRKIMGLRILLHILAIALFIGGVVRILATEETFRLFGIAKLWPGAAYQQYIYKVLGAFVFLSGIMLFMIARKMERYQAMLLPFACGWFFVGIVMGVSGPALKLDWQHYLPDVLFSALLAIVLFLAWLRSQAGHQIS